jgi:hypothetical protein
MLTRGFAYGREKEPFYGLPAIRTGLPMEWIISGHCHKPMLPQHDDMENNPANTALLLASLVDLNRVNLHFCAVMP